MPLTCPRPQSNRHRSRPGALRCLSRPRTLRPWCIQKEAQAGPRHSESAAFETREQGVPGLWGSSHQLWVDFMEHVLELL